MTQNSINCIDPIVQFVRASSASVFTCNVAIPADDTIPQITEGVQIFSQSFTPKFSTSTLVIEYDGQITCPLTPSAGAWAACALFVDSTANALASSTFRCRLSSSGPGGDSLNLVYTVASGSTSARTYQIRVGGQNTAACYINGNQSGTRLMGGVSQTNFSITEYY